jgi:branched-subunit amino acid aminotransferase/4-amino-4-deoxychorismate lyase
MPELAYINGLTTTLDEAKIAVNDSSFRLGFGVFETLRGYEGQLFRLNAHLDRLQSGALFLGISFDGYEIAAITRRLLIEGGLSQARVRIVVTGGQCGKPSTVVTVENYLPPSEPGYQRGLAAITSSINRRTDSKIYRHKTLNQIENSLARAEAERHGVVEAILLNEHSHLAETNRGNIFIVKGGILKTPALNSGILPGITRAAILDLAHGLNIPVAEGDVCSEEMKTADEVFVTSSLIEVMPITHIDSATIGYGRIGTITAKLRRAYCELVAAEMVADKIDKRHVA